MSKKNIRLVRKNPTNVRKLTTARSTMMSDAEKLIFLEGALIGMFYATTDVGVRSRLKLIFETVYPRAIGIAA
jgi:hypothetical protein